MPRGIQNNIIYNVNDISFEQQEGQSILDASIEGGYPINHSCRSGRCGFCKVKVLKGETLAYRREELSTQELANNWILSCARTALSNTYIDAGPLTKLEIPKTVNIPCGIKELTLLSKNVLRVTLRLPLAVRLAYLPGQYVDITNPSGITRTYSLAKAKPWEQTIELHIRKVKQGLMSHYWFKQAKINDLLTLEGPKGSFFLREIADKDLYMLATGTGIAPIQALSEAHNSLPKKSKARSITIIWGGREAKDFYLDLKKDLEHIKVIRTLSVKHANWTEAFGYVQDVLLDLKPKMLNARVYACGSPLMIENAKHLLVANGLNPQHFLADAFVSSGI